MNQRRTGGTPRATRLGVGITALGAFGLAACGATAYLLTSRRRAEERLAAERAETDLLLKVIDNTSAVISMRDNDGRHLMVNRQYEQLFGIRRQDIVGLTDHDLFPEQIADDFRANDLKALARGAPIEIE